MINRSHFHSCPAFTLIAVILFFCAFLPAEASSLSGAVNGLKPGQINSLNTMKTALSLLQTAHLEAAKKDKPDLKLQRCIVEKSGECVSRIVFLVQRSGNLNKTKKKVSSKLFALNNKTINSILKTTRQKVELLQETKLDKIQDTTAFFNSAEWQQLQYIISLSSYWLSWNTYYWCTFFADEENCLTKLLPEAVKGFSRSFIDFREESIITRSLFGRALCYKQMQEYNKAIKDIDSVMKRITPDDDLYFRTGYEKILISYLSGNFESALIQINNLQETMAEKKTAADFNTGISKLRIKTNLALLNKTEKKDKKKLKDLYYNILNELKKLAETDDNESGELYEFVKDNIDLFASLSDSRLSPVGSLAVADFHFNNKKYEKAIAGYKNLYQANNELIKKRVDDLYFRMGYAYCQLGDWNKAIKTFKTFFEKHPSSDLCDKSACTYYFAASNSYKEDPTKKTYHTYIKALKIYLEHCSAQEDKSEAHFQLGKYYLEEDQNDKASNEFFRVQKNSPNYIQARYYGVRSNIDILERYNSQGLYQSKKALKIYNETASLLEEFKSLLKTKKHNENLSEIELHSTILLAKLYIYGPEKTLKKGLNALSGFEKYSAGQKNKGLLMTAKRLKMECYRKLNMFIAAEKEIKNMIKPAALDLNEWTLLNEFGSSFYNTSVNFRNEKNPARAEKHAELAIMIYEKLSAIALKDISYKRFYDPIQLRLAELYQGIRKTETAKKIYMDTLEQNPESADAIYNLCLISEKEGRWEDALKIWRQFSDGVKNGSHYWFESRYHTANTLHNLGQTEDACSILNMTIVLHPELRDEEFKKDFMKLRNDICKDLKTGN